MKTKGKCKIVSLNIKLVIALMTAIILFQNFISFDWGELYLRNINEDARLKHMLEIKSSKSTLKIVKTYDPQLNKKIYRYIKNNSKNLNYEQIKKTTNALIEYSNYYNLDPVFVLALIKTESSINPKQVGSAGEIGLMQIRTETADWILEKSNQKKVSRNDLFDPVTNIKVGCLYLSYLREKFDFNGLAYITAYNSGPAAVNKFIFKNSSRTIASQELHFSKFEYPEKILTSYSFFYTKLFL